MSHKSEPDNYIHVLCRLHFTHHSVHVICFTSFTAISQSSQPPRSFDDPELVDGHYDSTTDAEIRTLFDKFIADYGRDYR